MRPRNGAVLVLLVLALLALVVLGRLYGCTTFAMTDDEILRHVIDLTPWP